MAQITLFMYMHKLATFLVLSTSTEESLAMSFVKAGIQDFLASMQHFQQYQMPNMLAKYHLVVDF